MESSIMGHREIGRLRQKCFSFGKTLLACGREFCFSLKMGDVACNRRQEGQTKMQLETEPFLFPEAGAASGSLSAEERLDWRQFGWGGIGGDSWKHSRRGRGEEAGLRTLEEDEPQEVTLKDIHDLLSEHVPQLAGIARRLWDDRQPAWDERCRWGGTRKWRWKWPVCFRSLGRSLKTFQRDLTTADQKIESAKKVSSRLRKRRKKRR